MTVKQIITVSLIGFLFFSCKQEVAKSNSETSTVEMQKDDATVQEHLEPLFLAGNFPFRGMDFSMTMDEIKGLEFVDLGEQSPTSLTYTDELDNAFMDVAYHFDQDLQKIEVDIYADDAATAEKFNTDINQFLNDKYKKRAELWEGSFDDILFTVYMKSVNEGNAIGTYLVLEEVK